MIQLRRTNAAFMRSSFVLLLLTTLVTALSATVSANQSPVTTVTWTSREDFETNAASNGSATSRFNLDTTSSPGDVSIADGTKDFIPNPSITAITSDNKIYTTGDVRTSIAVIDAVTKAIIKTIPLPGPVAGVVHNADAGKLYLGQADASQISILDLSTDILRTLPLNGAAGGAAVAAAYNPTDKKVYIINSADRTVTILDSVSDSVLDTRTVAAGATMGTFSAGKVYLTNRSNQYLTLIDGQTNQVENVVIDSVASYIGGQSPGNVGLRIPDVAALGITSAARISLLWNYDCLKENQRIQLQVRTASDAASLDLAHYAGPSGAEDRWYEVVCQEPTTAAKTESVTLDIPLTNAVELQVKLAADGLSSPVLHSVTLQYENYPDLVAGAVTVTPSIAAPGSTIQVASAVQNAGQGSSDSSTASVRLVGNGSGYLLGSVPIPALVSGQNHAFTTSVALPAVAVGDYTIEVCADSADLIKESNESNNCTSTPLVVTYPDLVVPSLSAAPTLTMGSSASITTSVKNQERVAAGASKVGLYLTRNGVDTFLGERAVSALQPGATDTTASTVTIPSNIPTGDDYYIKACADYDGTVTETVESNNCALVPTPVSVYSVLPDLVVKSISASVANGKINYSVTVKNMGTNTATTNYTGIFLSTDAVITPGEDLYLGSTPSCILTGGSSITFNGTLTVPPNRDGVFYIGASADRTLSIAEADENNNSKASDPVTITNDLVVTSVTGTVTNGVMSYTATLLNRGNGLANAYYAIYLSEDDVITMSDHPLTGTPGGGPLCYGGTPVTVTGTGDVPINLSGTFYVGAFVDRTSTVHETDETNNGTAGNQVTLTNDLVVSAVSGSVNNGVVSYSITLLNRGNGIAPASWIIFLSDDDVITMSDYALQGTPGTMPKCYGNTPITLTGSGTVPPVVPAATYYVGGFVDRTSSVAESDETNNGSAGNTIVLP